MQDSWFGVLREIGSLAILAYLCLHTLPHFLSAWRKDLVREMSGIRQEIVGLRIALVGASRSVTNDS